MRMKKNSKRPHELVLLSICIICMLAIFIPTGCSLARVDSTGKESKDDVLCGVWVVSGKDSEGLDMNAFSSEDANTLLLYRVNKDGESYTMSEVSGSIQSDLQSYFDENTGKTSSDFFGTLLVSPDQVTNARIYSIYQRPDGTRYAGKDPIPVTVDPSADELCLYTLKSDKTAVSDGTANSESINFQITFKAHSPSGSVKVFELGTNNQILKTNAIDLSHPDAEAASAFKIEASAKTDYVIVEEAGTDPNGEVTRTVYSRDSFSSDNPYLHTIYQATADGLLNLQSLQITF